eukprot:scaffold233354_cov17-Prasinocladus_malaysianus.AAC.1
MDHRPIAMTACNNLRGASVATGLRLGCIKNVVVILMKVIMLLTAISAIITTAVVADMIVTYCLHCHPPHKFYHAYHVNLDVLIALPDGCPAVFYGWRAAWC